MVLLRDMNCRLCPGGNKKRNCNKYTKNNWIKLKEEVGMTGPKSTQTRFVEIIISTIHPYACFLSCRNKPINSIIIIPVANRNFSNMYSYIESRRLKRTHWSRSTHFPLWESTSIGAWWSRKASVGMYIYSGYNYPHKSYLCTFWPCHPYFFLQFYSIFFYTCNIVRARVESTNGYTTVFFRY
jgi:hypothetical protein